MNEAERIAANEAKKARKEAKQAKEKANKAKQDALVNIMAILDGQIRAAKNALYDNANQIKKLVDKQKVLKKQVNELYKLKKAVV